MTRQNWTWAAAILLFSILIVQNLRRLPYPLIMLTSETMQPTIYRGDILFTLPVRLEDLRVNDVIVFHADSKKHHPMPIVHRLVRKRLNEDGEFEYLTKGDGSPIHDGYGRYYHHWLQKEQITARVRGVIPYLGYPAVLLEDYPSIRLTIIGACMILIIRQLMVIKTRPAGRGRSIQKKSYT